MDPVILLTAFAIGALHTFEADHMAAVSAFVVRRPRIWDALLYGLRWAAGHGGVILIVGTLLVLLRIQLPEGSGVALEKLVGLSLVVLGLWVFLTARSSRGSTRDASQGAHGELSNERKVGVGTRETPLARGHDHVPHSGAATAMGALHGLAGTAPAVALIPIAGMESATPAFLYLACFGVGTAISMGAYAVVAGWGAGRLGARSDRLAQGLTRVAGLGTVAVGALWMIG